MRTAHFFTVLIWLWPLTALAQDTIVVRPKEIDDILTNPGIGFMTFQRFNGDKLNEGTKWTEGYPIVYQDFDGGLENDRHPSGLEESAGYPRSVLGHAALEGPGLGH